MITIRVSMEQRTVDISGVTPDFRVTTGKDEPPSLEPLSGIYAHSDKRVLAFCEGTWFQLQRSDGRNDVSAMAVPPNRAEVKLLPDHECSQEQSLLFELASDASSRGTEIWVCDDDVYYRARTSTGEHTFRLLQAGSLRIEACDIPPGARLSLTADQLLEDACDKLDELADMYNKPKQKLPRDDGGTVAGAGKSTDDDDDDDAGPSGDAATPAAGDAAGGDAATPAAGDAPAAGDKLAGELVGMADDIEEIVRAALNQVAKRAGIHFDAAVPTSVVIDVLGGTLTAMQVHRDDLVRRLDEVQKLARAAATAAAT